MGSSGQGQSIEAVLEDRVDVTIGARTDTKSAGARGLEALVAVALGEAEEAEARAIALLGMGPALEDGLDQRLGVRADPAAPADQARGRPLEVSAVRLGHVLGDRGVASG